MEYLTVYIDAENLDDKIAQMAKEGFELVTLMPTKFLVMRSKRSSDPDSGGEGIVGAIYEVQRVYAVFRH